MTTTQTRTSNPAQSVVAKYASLAPREFDGQIESNWQALESIKDNVKQLVSQDQLTPLQGIGIMACATSQVFGYQAFHGQPTLADVWQFSNGQTR